MMPDQFKHLEQFAESNASSQIASSMAGLCLSSGGNQPSGVGNVSKFDVDSFLSVALQILWHVDGFKLMLSSIANSTDALVTGLQVLMSSLSENDAVPPSNQLLRAALPSIFADSKRARIAAASEASEKFEMLLSSLSAATDGRLVSCIEQFFSM